MCIRDSPGGARLNYDNDIYLPDFTFTDLSDGSEHSIREVYSANKLRMLLHWDPLQESSGDFTSTIVRRFHTLFRDQGFTVVGLSLIHISGGGPITLLWVGISIMNGKCVVSIPICMKH